MIVLPGLRLLSGTIAYRPARIPPFIAEPASRDGRKAIPVFLR
jgi:hypothetical protein